jgi:hypothetical protein
MGWILVYILIGIITGALLSENATEFLMCLAGWPLLAIIFIWYLISEVINYFKCRS